MYTKYTYSRTHARTHHLTSHIFFDRGKLKRREMPVGDNVLDVHLLHLVVVTRV